MAWAPDYVTRAEIKAQLGIDTLDTADDALIDIMITTASRAIDTETNRQFGSTSGPEVRYYPAEWRDERGVWVAVIDDTFASSLTIANGDGDSITDYRLEPRNAAAIGRPYERLVVGRDSSVVPVWADYELTVTANPWGWTATPTAIKGATRLQVSRLFARRESPYGVAGSPDLGSEIRLLAKLDPDVAVAVAGYVRTRRPA